MSVLNGLSAHADQTELLAFAESMRERGPLQKVILVHGEPRAQDALQALLTARGFPSVVAPEPGQIVQV